MRYVGSGDTEPAELLPISVLNGGGLYFDQFFSGPDLPYAYRRVNGRVVSGYPIAAGLANVPAYAAAKAVGMDLMANRYRLSLVTSATLAALSVLFLFLALKRLVDARTALLFTSVYALGTCVWSVASRGLWQHAPSLCFLTAAIWLFLSDEDRSVGLSGLFFALAVVSRTTNVLLAVPAAGYVLARRRRAFPLFAGLALLPAAAVVAYSKVYLGNLLAFGQIYSPGGFTGKFLPGIVGVLFSPSRGLFVFSPVLVAGLAGAALLFERGADVRLRVLAFGTAALIVLFGCWAMWWGGTTFGYRLILEAVPVLAILSAFAWKRWIARRRSLRAAFLVLLGFSVYVQVLGAYLYPSSLAPDVDFEPAALWRVRESDPVLLSRKLFSGERAPLPVSMPSVWWNPDRNDDTIPGWIDGSPGGTLVKGPLSVSGWAKSRTGEVDVRIVLDDGRVVVPDRFPRPDVARVLPELGDASRTGFRALVEPRDPVAAERRLAIELKDASGRVRRIGPIRFRWQQTSIR